MASTLDKRVHAIIDAVTSPDGMLPLSSWTSPTGVEMPMIATAPPTLGMFFAHFCTQHADALFLIDGDQRVTFGEAHAAATRVAEALVGGYGVKVGDRVGIAMRNAPAWVILYMGTLMAGGVATLLNGWWQGGELCTGIRDTGVAVVFVDPPRAKRLAECDDDVLCEVVTIDLSQPVDSALEPIFAKHNEGAALPSVGADDLATILFTSGSTGQSKGAYSTHRAVVQGAFNYIAQALLLLRLGMEDGTIKADAPQHALLMTVPLFHVTGEVPMLLVSFAIGRKIVFMPKWDAGEAMRLIAAEKVTNFTGVPLMSWEMLNHPDRANYDLSSLQTLAAGGAPRPPEHVRRLADGMHIAPSLGYGLTETNAVGCGIFGSNYSDKPNSTGIASRPLVELAILDEAGVAMPQGARGEVCIRSVANFTGYWGRIDDTKAAVTVDGFFRTGDIGYLDEDGYLFIVDRKKDIIIRGGENISCQEVEAAIYAHSSIAEAAVFGLPDERLGEIVGAVVHFREDAASTEDALRVFLTAGLAAFKVPQRIWISALPLPKLGTEKIDKVGLKRIYRGRHDSEYGAAKINTNAA